MNLGRSPFTRTPPRIFLAGRFALALLVLAPFAHSQAGRNPMPFAGLAITAEANVRVFERNQAEYNAGRISAADTDSLTHTFVLRNAGQGPIVVTQCQPSCHCTTYEWLKVAGRKFDADRDTNPTLPPGEEALLKVTVQLARQEPGPVSQGVFIFTASHQEPVARVFLIGELATGQAADAAK